MQLAPTIPFLKLWRPSPNKNDFLSCQGINEVPSSEHRKCHAAWIQRFCMHHCQKLNAPYSSPSMSTQRLVHQSKPRTLEPVISATGQLLEVFENVLETKPINFGAFNVSPASFKPKRVGEPVRERTSQQLNCWRKQINHVFLKFLLGSCYPGSKEA